MQTGLLVWQFCHFSYDLTHIDECKTGNHSCISDYNCHNTIGSYECFCPKGQSGNGTKEERCHKQNVLPEFVIGGEQLKHISKFYFLSFYLNFFLKHIFFTE